MLKIDFYEPFLEGKKETAAMSIRGKNVWVSWVRS